MSTTEVDKSTSSKLEPIVEDGSEEDVDSGQSSPNSAEYPEEPFLLTQYNDDESLYSSAVFSREGSTAHASEADGDGGDSYESSDSSDNEGSVLLEPLLLNDEDYDTDLDMDEDKWLYPERYDRDTTGLNKYMRACALFEVKPVRYFIQHMHDEELSLKHHGLGPVAMKALSIPLEINTVIEKIDLEGNGIEAEGTIHLCRVLRENVYVTDLVLSENKIESVGAIHMAQLLANNRTLESVDLTGNEITDTAAEYFYFMLKKNTTLRRLLLRHNCFEDYGAQFFRDALSENEALEILDLSWNHFQSKGCVAIANGLKENFGLKELNISMNGFGLEGAKALGDAIKHNRTLLKLDAMFCRLPLHGAMSMSDGLQTNDILQQLNVGYNSLHADGAFALLVGVDKNESSSLNLLNFGNTVVKPEFQDLQEKLESKRNIKIIYGGVTQEVPTLTAEYVDPMEAFKKDPFTKFKQWVEKAGYRLIDVLRHFDRDNSMTISREELITGIEKLNIEMTKEQIEILLQRMDKDGDGEIDFSELVQEDTQHRKTKRNVLKVVMEHQNEVNKSSNNADAFIQEAAGS
ncbi:leucine-rich repeat-containing protein 74B-like [Gigantopelta aegis]|uniref:leucine-rich repeat-containing protein 74B-like n=1 Tax=Gigantopelta aegis TaxID=1735272 RepID=UPI001B88A8B5|nr:leucine-rich repeat-containing protein 74B-like [Gigantopelta aegis]XP_041354188.1 leucine-rich repeat-containing protein 74B-like [Gigantopelta aegis]